LENNSAQSGNDTPTAVFPHQIHSAFPDTNECYKKKSAANYKIKPEGKKRTLCYNY